MLNRLHASVAALLLGVFALFFWRDSGGGEAAEPVAAAALRQDSLLVGAVEPRADATPILDGNALLQSETVPSEFAAFDDWIARFVENPHRQHGLHQEGRELAARRRPAMVELMRTDPELALARAVSRELRDQLPRDVAAELETPFDSHGDLEVLILCGDDDEEDHDHSVTRHLTLRDERYEAFVYGRRLAQTTKYDLPVHGVMLDGVAALHESPLRILGGKEAAEAGAAAGEIPARLGDELFILADRETAGMLEQEVTAAESTPGPEAFHGMEAQSSTSAPSSASWTTGEKKVLYIRLDFTDEPGAPLSADAAATIMTEASDFFAANSNGRTSLTTQVIPVTLTMGNTAAWYREQGYLQLRDDALTAARAYDQQQGGGGTFDPDRHDLHVLAFKSVYPGWGGRAAVGGKGVWLNGFFDAGITTHELGHNYGVFHANAWEPAELSPAGDGRHVEYADRFDVMGISSNVSNGSFQDGHFNSWFKSYLGWMDETGTLEVTTSGVYRLYRHDHAGSGNLRALKITNSDGKAYWLGARRLFDQNQRLMNGIDVRWGNTLSGLMTSRGSQLLDMKPQSSAGFDDHALAAGEHFSDFEQDLRISPLSTGGTGADAWVDVEIIIGAKSGPHIDSHPESQTGVEGESVTFRVRTGGSIPLAFQWRKDGTNISGATQDTLRIDNLTRFHAGTYTVRITNNYGSTTSEGAILSIIPAGTASPGALDPGFDPGAGPNGPVYSIVPQPDGKVLIGGTFTSVGGISRAGIARLNSDGTLDTTFNPGSGFDNTVWTLSLQPDGKILAGGTFTVFDNIGSNRIVRLLPDGQFDMSFNVGTGANQAVRAFALQDDGKILVGGAFTSFNGESRNSLTRLLPDGRNDNSFQLGTGANGSVWTLLAHAQQIYVGGAFGTFAGVNRQGIVRLTQDGAVDTSFDPGAGADGSVYAIQPAGDGGVVAAGSFVSFDGHAAGRIVRLLADGSVDSLFRSGSGADDFIWSLAVQKDGKVVAGGWFQSFDGIARQGVVRLHRDGTLDAAFKPGAGANDMVWPVALQTNGGVLVGGRFTRIDTTSRNRVAQLHGDSTAASPSAETNGYDAWFASHGAGTSQSNPAEDPGQQGVANLLRYAFHLDAERPSRQDLPRAGTVVQAQNSGSERFLTLTYRRLKQHNDLRYTVETSSDLSTWTALEQPLELQVLDAGEAEVVIVRDEAPMGDAPRFLRVRVTLFP